MGWRPLPGEEENADRSAAAPAARHSTRFHFDRSDQLIYDLHGVKLREKFRTAPSQPQLT